MEELEKKKILEGHDEQVVDSVPEEEENQEQVQEQVVNSDEEQPVETSTTEEQIGNDPDGENVPSPEEIVSEESEPVEDEEGEPEPAPATPEGEPEPVKEQPEPQMIDENGVMEASIKYFTQDDMNEVVGKTRVDTRNKTFKYIYDRYGVKDEAELDDLIGNAQRYDTLKEEYEGAKKDWDTSRSDSDRRLSEMSEEIALMKSGISQDRYEDAKLILKGKGLDVSLENINAELESHPEWLPAKEEPKVEDKPVTRIVKLGNEKPAPVEESEEEQAMRLFKLR